VLLTERAIVGLEGSGEGLVEERFFQRIERGKLLLVDAFESLGFSIQRVKECDDALLFWERRHEQRSYCGYR
jgi:hypothetical protein